MIITDSSAVIVYERVPTPRMKQIIADNDAAVCGITIAELFAGVRSPRDEAKLQSALVDFKMLAIPDTIWVPVGRNQSFLLSKGLTVPIVDTTLASIAIFYDFELWTYDAHFAMIQQFLPALKLFQEPP